MRQGLIISDEMKRTLGTMEEETIFLVLPGDLSRLVEQSAVAASVQINAD